MSQQRYRSGRCLCGEVQFEVKNASICVAVCHCGMCRHWVGGPFMAVDCGTEVTFDGAENISIYDSSEWAERGFCKKCGSNLFYRIKGLNQYQIPPGLFDDDSNLVFNLQVFVDERPEYYDFSNNTNNMTGAEVYAKYGPPAE
ncbi:MAG: GFA family protein [bacterium]